MPGNEVEDRFHNFFGQENLSQGQHHSQTGHGNWPVLNSNLLVGNQRQIGASFISDSKNYNVQQSDDSERGGGSQSLRVQHGFNLTQSNVGSEFGRSFPQNQHTTLNGYVQGHQFVQTRQNEADLLGVDTEADQHNLTLQGISILESQRGSGGPELIKKNSSRLEDTESPVNYDFLGGQQQMIGQQPGMLQSLPRQHSGINDMQVLQQQFMLTQMQELHRQQPEERQQSTINQVSPVPKQTAPNHSAALVNGIPINEASNYPWPPEILAGNSNWLQRGASQVIQGSSSGLMLSPEQGHALRLMGLVPQQVDQSLYGVPISSVRSTPSQTSHDQVDKPAFHQVSASGNSFSGHQYATFPGQASMHEETFASRQNFQAKNMFGPAAGQGLNSVLDLEHLQQVNPQQRSASMQELNGRQELNGSSETSHEKTLLQVAPSQSVSSLDPTEEKILFGSDENLWDTFGRSARAGNMSDNTDFFNGFPSVQSGSWSALMQSAVAETSSADVGIQEEWSGSTFGDTGPPTGNQQPLTIKDSSKQPAWTDNSLQTASALSSRPFSHSDDANRPSTRTNYFKVPVVQQPGLKTPHQQGDSFQNNSSNRSISQFQEEGSKWLDRNPLQKPSTEGSHICGDVAQPSGIEISTKISGSLVHPQIISSYNIDGQPYKRSNGWNFTESLSPDSSATLKHHETEKFSQLTQSSDHKGATHQGLGHGTSRWRAFTVPNSSVASEHVKSGLGSLQVFREDLSSNGIAAITNSSTLRANQERSQQLQNINNLDFWKDVQSTGNSKGNEVLGKYRHHLDENPQVFESSGNNELDKGTVEINEKANSNKIENSSDSSRSNMLHHTPTSGLRDGVWLDASDSHNLIGSKQKLSNQLNRKPGTRRFQYHPMGDVDVVEPSYGPKHNANSQALAPQVSQGLRGHEQVYVGQSRFSDHADRNSTELEKVDTKGLDEISSKSMLPRYVPNSSAPYDNSVGNYASNRTATSSQNMLELLHKVDQSNEHGIGRHISSSNHYLSSEMPERETSDGPVSHIQQNQFATAQGFGLQLAPPSQRLPIPDCVLSSQSSSQTVLGSSHVASGTGDKANMRFAPTASVQSLASSYESSQGEFRQNISDSSGQTPNKLSQYNVHGKFSTAFMSGSPSHHHQGQHATVASGQLMLDQTGQSVLVSAPDASTCTQNDLACSAELSQLNSSDQNHSRDPAQSIPSSEHMQVSLLSVAPANSQLTAFSKMIPNLWNSVTSQQHLLGAQPSKAPSNLFMSHHQSDNNSGPRTLDNQDAQKGGNGRSGFIASSINLQGFAGKEQSWEKNPRQQVLAENNDPVENTLSLSQGRESAVKPLSDSPHSNAASTQRDIEAFGRSLRPNNAMHQSYSLLHQVQAMKTGEIDPSNHGAKRFKGPDSDRDAQRIVPKGAQPSYGYNNMVRDASCNNSSGPSGDSTMLSFSAKPGESRDTNASSQDMFGFVQENHHNLSSSSGATAVRSENSQISPQMAPSWFEQYGSFKNGQTLSTYDVQKTATAKDLERPFIAVRPSDSLLACSSMDQVNAAAADASHLASVRQSSYSTSVANQQLASPHLLPLDVTDQSMITVGLKKRKSATSQLIPWHKESMEGSQKLQNISVAELVWAQAFNRLIEKVEDEAEVVEDGQLILIPKRRLILTAQLMQQLLRPPPARVISADSRSHYESIAYFIARSVLGDACSAFSSPGTDAFLAPNSRSLLSEKLKTFGSAHHQYLKVMEDFIGKARKLENDMLRLDNRASILDLRVEYQDLERFSVINRFAKFHGRGQVEGPETSSSSDTTANSQKSCPQRYVTALPMPRNLPDRVQCLSL